MSHDLTIRQDGTAEMFYVREVPWHGLGTRVEEALTAEQAIRTAGLDWTVGMKPLFDERGKVVPRFKGITREDTGLVLGIATDAYRPLQNKEAFEFADSLLASGQAKYETAGSLSGGQRIWVLARLPENFKIAGEDIAPYFVLTNSHRGNQKAIARCTPVRVVCQNTLAMALGKGDKHPVATISHFHNYDEQLAEAAKVLGFAQNYYKSFLEVATELVQVRFDRAQFESLTKTLTPMPESPSKQLVTMTANRRDKMMEAWQAPDLNDIRETKWGAYNAISDFADHGRKVKGSGLLAAERAYTRTFEDTSLKDDALKILREV